MGGIIKSIIPKPIRNFIKNTNLYNSLSNKRRAQGLANTTKRLDLCSAQVAEILHLAGNLKLRDKVCVEIGSGWVLSHALIFYLLGAKKVIATDVEALARPDNLYKALHKSVDFMIRDILAPFEDHDKLRERINHLLSIKSFNFEVLKSLGIEYVAPIDLATKSLDSPIDFVYSHAVFEHVPIDDIVPLLSNIEKDLTEGGIMIHCVHTEDHQGIEDNPFAFLAEPSSTYGKNVQTDRGNRLRSSEWEKLITEVPNMKFSLLYLWCRRDRPLPKHIDSSVRYNDEDDLRTSHLGIIGRKQSTQP